MKVFLFEFPLKRRGYYFISNKTLDQIQHGFVDDGVYHPPMKQQFEELLKNRLLKLKKIDEELSLIK